MDTSFFSSSRMGEGGGAETAPKRLLLGKKEALGAMQKGTEISLVRPKVSRTCYCDRCVRSSGLFQYAECHKNEGKTWEEKDRSVFSR